MCLGRHRHLRAGRQHHRAAAGGVAHRVRSGPWRTQLRAVHRRNWPRSEGGPPGRDRLADRMSSSGRCGCAHSPAGPPPSDGRPGTQTRPPRSGARCRGEGMRASGRCAGPEVSSSSCCARRGHVGELRRGRGPWTATGGAARRASAIVEARSLRPRRRSARAVTKITWAAGGGACGSSRQHFHPVRPGILIQHTHPARALDRRAAATPSTGATSSDSGIRAHYLEPAPAPAPSSTIGPADRLSALQRRAWSPRAARVRGPAVTAGLAVEPPCGVATLAIAPPRVLRLSAMSAQRRRGQYRLSRPSRHSAISTATGGAWRDTVLHRARSAAADPAGPQGSRIALGALFAQPHPVAEPLLLDGPGLALASRSRRP